MNWFYALNGQQAGPVEDAELDGLVLRGVIAPATLVWHSGMPTWQPYSAVRSVPAAQPFVPAGAGAPVAPYVAPGQTRCTECGRIFPADEVVRLGTANVCAGCKPLVLQKIREGLPTTSRLPVAGFWIRFGAVFMDGLILSPITFSVILVPIFFGGRFGDSNSSQAYLGLAQLISILVPMVYDILMTGRYGATLGKMICNLRVVRSDGSRFSYGLAAGRYFSKMISGAILGIGYLMAAFDDQRRALHDYICDTRVIYKS